MTNENLPITSTGIGDITLGDERESVRQRLGRFSVFRRANDGPEIDFFEDRGIQVTYDSMGRVTFIEMGGPARPTLDGVTLLGRTLSAVARDLRARGLSVRETAPAIFEVVEWNVALFVPDGDSDGDIAGVSIGHG